MGMLGVWMCRGSWVQCGRQSPSCQNAKICVSHVPLCPELWLLNCCWPVSCLYRWHWDPPIVILKIGIFYHIHRETSQSFVFSYQCLCIFQKNITCKWLPHEKYKSSHDQPKQRTIEREARFFNPKAKKLWCEDGIVVMCRLDSHNEKTEKSWSEN